MGSFTPTPFKGLNDLRIWILLINKQRQQNDDPMQKSAKLQPEILIFSIFEFWGTSNQSGFQFFPIPVNTRGFSPALSDNFSCTANSSFKCSSEFNTVLEKSGFKKTFYEGTNVSQLIN